MQLLAIAILNYWMHCQGAFRMEILAFPTIRLRSTADWLYRTAGAANRSSEQVPSEYGRWPGAFRAKEPRKHRSISGGSSKANATFAKELALKRIFAESPDHRPQGASPVSGFRLVFRTSRCDGREAKQSLSKSRNFMQSETRFQFSSLS